MLLFALPHCLVFSLFLSHFYAFAKAILKILICTFSFSSMVVVYPTHSSSVHYTHTHTHTHTHVYIYIYFFTVYLYCAEHPGRYWGRDSRFCSLHLVTKIWEIMSQLQKWKKYQGAVGLCSQNTMPFFEVVEDSVSRECSSSDWKHEDLLLEAFLVTFIFYTPDWGYYSTLFLSQVWLVQIPVLPLKCVGWPHSHLVTVKRT